MSSPVVALWLFLAPAGAEVNVTSVSVQHSGGYIAQDERTWILEADMTLRRSVSFENMFEDAEEHSEFCTKLRPKEQATIKRAVNYLIEDRWRNTKILSQWEGTGECYDVPGDKLSISYEWEGGEESIEISYSSHLELCGTEKYSYPEVLVLHKLLTGVLPYRYDSCS